MKLINALRIGFSDVSSYAALLLFVCVLSVMSAIPIIYADTNPSMSAGYSVVNIFGGFNVSNQTIVNASEPLDFVTCPSSDYTYCWRWSYTDHSSTATAEIYLSDVKPNVGDVAVRPYINVGVNGGSKLYVVTNKASYNDVYAQAACSAEADGCPGATEISPGKYYLLSSYGTYTDCPVFISSNSVIAPDGWRILSFATYGWTGTGNCLPVKYAPDIRVDSFISPPTQVTAGSDVSFTVRIKNYGDQSVTKNAEAAIIPTTFWSSSLDYSPESYTSIPRCCSGNSYYDAKSVTVAPFSTESVVFTVRAPTKTSIDACDTVAPVRSAWGSSFKYTSGIYDACGGGYASSLETTGPTICTYDPACSYNDNDDCVDSNTVQDWYQETACNGGCSSWIQGSKYDCSSGYYCMDPGDAYCKACSNSCDGTCQSSACYGTDPDCTSDGGLKSCGGGVSCTGEITAIVRDNKGSSMSGINVLIDGVAKDATDATGKKTSSITDSSCGTTHVMRTYCSDGRYCGSSAATIGVNGDHDDVYFNCNVCLPLPGLKVYATASSTYSLSDPISLEIAVKDPSNTAVANTYIALCDPFGETECTKYWYYTDVNGIVRHNSKASKLGVHTFGILATKDGYKQAILNKIVSVGSFTGKISVDVKDPTNKAIPFASVYLDEKFIGKTNEYGLRTLYPTSQGSYNVKVTCPSGKLCDTKTVSVIGDASASFKCDCTVPTGDLRVDVTNPSGYPVANVYIFLDGTQTDQYITNAFGYTYVSTIPQGSHEVMIMYNITNEINYGLYIQNKTVIIGSGTNILKFTADPKSAQKVVLSASNETGATAIFVPFLIAAAAEAVDVISVGLSMEDYCKCIYTTDSGIKSCVSSIESCVAESDIRKCIGGALSNAVDKTGNCKLEAAFLVGDVASPFIPVGIMGHFAVYAGKELKWVDKASDLGRIVYDKLEGVWKYPKKVGDNVVEYVAKVENKIVRKSLMLMTMFWKEEARLGLDMIADKGGKEAAENFVYHLGLGRAENVAAGITTIKNRGVNLGFDMHVDRWTKRLANADDTNIKGVAAEVEADVKHINDGGGLKEVGRKIYKVDDKDLTDLDGELADGSIIEVKSGKFDLADAKKDVDDKLRQIKDAKSQPRYKTLGDLIFEFKFDTPINNPSDLKAFEDYMNTLKNTQNSGLKSWGHLE